MKKKILTYVLESLFITALFVILYCIAIFVDEHSLQLEDVAQCTVLMLFCCTLSAVICLCIDPELRRIRKERRLNNGRDRNLK